MGELRTRLTYGNVVATLALFIALGGASYAAFKLPKNSVGAKQLKKNAVSGVKVKNHSLTGADINTSSLGTVPSAAAAGNAQTLDGLSAAQVAQLSAPRCPSGTKLAVGVCIETEEHPAESISAAINACREAERRLPTEGELLAYGFKYLTGKTPPLEWVEPEYFDGTIWRANIAASSNENWGVASTETGIYPYRCVAAPST